MNTELAVSTKQLTKTFSGKEVIRNCTMSVEKGTIYGFLGKNGAGKTTAFKILLGLLKPTMGKATVLGMDSVKNNLDILKRTGSLIEIPIFYEHLSAIENLQIHLDYMGIENADIAETLNMVGLPDVGTQPVSTFSLGMRQRLGIARALVHKPELLILDEPVNGLDPVGIKEMRELFCKLVKENNVTILISSHILSEIEQTAVMSAKFIVEEYAGKRAVLLFSYPVARRNIFSSKVKMIFLYTVAAMFLYGTVIFGIFFTTEAMFPLCADEMNVKIIVYSFLSLLCYSLLAGVLGIIALWFGFGKNSVAVNIVAAVIIATIMCQIMAMTSLVGTIAFLVVGGTIAIIVVKNLVGKVEKMEV